MSDKTGYMRINPKGLEFPPDTISYNDITPNEGSKDTYKGLKEQSNVNAHTNIKES